MSSPAEGRLKTALERLHFSRQYTKNVLQGLTPEEWFWSPSELTTHIAWQVAHLAVAQYSLCLRRLRGRTEADEALMPTDFFERFKIGSVPVAGAANNPSSAEIIRTFDAVYQQAVTELSLQSDEQLDVPTEPPHLVFQTKLGAIEWCSQHELIHAGQIGLLRRLMGKPPLR